MDKIRSIVVPTDFSALADAAAARAATLARLDGAAVHLVHALTLPIVVNPYEFTVPVQLGEDLRRAAQEKLERLRKAIEAQGVSTVSAQVCESLDPVASIADVVRAHAADLVVMGTHGRRGIQHAFLGSVAERALRALDRPVLAVKEDPESAARPIAKIVLAVDFSPHSERAVEVTAGLAERLSASVDLVHAFYLPSDYYPNPSAAAMEFERGIEAEISDRLDGIVERLERQRIRVKMRFLRGRPDAVIADVATQSGCQLIIMGTRGQSGLAHVLLGSVAERTLRTAPCSVLCVKASHAAARTAQSA
jgi:nucleotide-binding universal stress UspA family protein